MSELWTPPQPEENEPPGPEDNVIHHAAYRASEEFKFNSTVEELGKWMDKYDLALGCFREECAQYVSNLGKVREATGATETETVAGGFLVGFQIGYLTRLIQEDQQWENLPSL